MSELGNEVTWECPSPFEKSFFEDPKNIDSIADLLGTSVEAIEEMMTRELIVKLCDLKNPVPPTIKDMGTRPHRFRIQRGKPEEIPMTITIYDENEKPFRWVLNGDWDSSSDLIQISQRLKDGKPGPAFDYKEDIQEKPDGYWVTFKITMSGYDPNDYEYEVSELWKIKNLEWEQSKSESTNPIAA